MSGVRRWPLFLIAAPAAVAIWSGWVGLGELCGFGPVRLLPGISGLTVNTAITLPVGVEAYAAYALGAWMSPGSPPGARRFARWSALGALAYGMAGQVIYHLLAAAHAVAAPWPVVVVVSCMPVVVLGFAAALTHLLRVPEDVAGEHLPVGDLSGSPATQAGTVPSSSFEAAKARMREAADRRFRYSDNEARAGFGLTRAEAAKARKEVTAERSRGGPFPTHTGTAPAAHVPAGEPPQAAPQPAPAGTLARATANGDGRG